MEDFNNPGASSIPPATPPMPEVPPAAPPITPPATPPVQQFNSGGNVGGKFFDGVSFVDVGMIALATAGILTIIYYYRKRIEHLKREKSVVQKKVEELEVNVVNALGPNYKKM